MRQRAMIAMAIANSPSLLIADEPTTALDVTIQAQVLEVLKNVQDETHAATILITHDLGIVAELCRPGARDVRRAVVESGDVHTIFDAPAPSVHDRAAWTACPKLDGGRGVAPRRSPASRRASSTGRRAARSIRAASSRRAGALPRGRAGRCGETDDADHAAACHFADELRDAKSKLRVGARRRRRERGRRSPSGGAVADDHERAGGCRDPARRGPRQVLPDPGRRS